MAVVTDDDGDLFGKVASDLMEDAVIDRGYLYGTSKYVTGYTGFSGDTEEQEGNYIALKGESVEGATLTAKIIGGVHAGPYTLDSDGIFIVRLVPTTSAIEFVSTKDGESTTRVIDISTLTRARA